MENNFGLILLTQVSGNKEKFLGLLRRNGVLVNTNISNEDLTNMILKAMQKSESFKKETILLMGVLMGSNDDAFANFTSSNPFGGLPTFDSSLFGNETQTAQATTTSTSDAPKKPFSETTVGTIFDKLSQLGNAYLKNKELDVRKVEAKTGGKISENQVKLNESGGKEKDDDGKSNTGLYVGLAIGGVALIGLLVYLATKKK